MKLAIICIIAFVLLFVVVLAVGFFVPASWECESNVTIQSDAATVYPYLSTLSRWPEWTVWNQELDPNVQYTYSGPPDGRGATSEWTGEQLGRGKIVITEATPDRSLAYDLIVGDAARPAKGSFELVEGQGEVKVVWRSSGEVEGFGPLSGLLGQLVVEPGLERQLTDGLERLKKLVEP